MRKIETDWALEVTPLQLKEINDLLGTNLSLSTGGSYWEVAGRGVGEFVPPIVGTPAEVYQAVYHFLKGVRAGRRGRNE